MSATTAAATSDRGLRRRATVGVHLSGRADLRGRWADFVDGATAVAPMLIGYAPFALTVGAAAAAEGPWLPRWLATFLIYGGSANLATLNMLDAGAGLAAVILTGLVTHARLLAYSSSMAPHWRGERRGFRLAASAVLIEPTWALGTARYEAADGIEQRAGAHRYYAGVAVTLTAGWGGMVTAGMLTGASDGAVTLLALAVPLSLMAMIVPAVTDRPAVVTVVVAAMVALLAADMPAGTGVLTAMVAGVLAGAVAQKGADR